MKFPMQLRTSPKVTCATTVCATCFRSSDFGECAHFGNSTFAYFHFGGPGAVGEHVVFQVETRDI